MKHSILIEQGGMLTTVQDMGRFGYQQFGMSVCGAMDTLSCQLANLLLGNNPEAACLETTIIGPVIRFNSETCFAIAGADLQPLLNNSPIKNYQPHIAHQNDILAFRGLKEGCRAYLAFSGGIDVPTVMGSRSTYLLANVGGHCGRALKNGDIIPLGHVTDPPPVLKIPDKLLHVNDLEQSVRVIPGPEANQQGANIIIELIERQYIVGSNSNRMGYRLEGSPLSIREGVTNIISSATPAGTIQLPADGLPIILMADRQTTGGYARIAVVASVDLPIVAQLKPGDSIRFKQIGMEQAQALYIEQQLALKALTKPYI